MAKNLVVVESPAKARTVGRFLGNDYKVAASLGHVRDLPRGEMGVTLDNGFNPTYQVLDSKKKVVQELKRASKDADTIYLATDPDREGEAISWHLVEAANWKRKATRRVVFHEITENAIREAFEHPRGMDLRLVNAQQARRILDRLVGYQLSPLLWKKISGGRKMGLSAGRVQSVALRIIVEREREIEAFKPVEYWTIEALMQRQESKDGEREQPQFKARFHGSQGERKALHLPAQEATDAVIRELEGAAYAVANVNKREVRSRPAPPFITSTLQQEAWRKLRFPARKTMTLAQQLYEGLPLGPEDSVGLITYMRTDSTNVAEAAIRETREYIRSHYGADYTVKTARKYTKKSKGAQEAHEAIRPTSVRREPDAVRRYLDRDQHRLYELIWKRMVASQMADALSDSTRVEVTASGPNTGGKTYLFRATGSVLRFAGFRAVYLEDRDDAQEDEDQNVLPAVVAGDRLDCLRVTPEQHFTQPPARYNDASLVRTLEERGIGRPSTYAPILSIIQERNYVVKDHGRFKPTELGKVVSDQLTNYFPSVIDLGFTAAMEENLDEIARGHKQWTPVLKEFYGPFKEKLEEATNAMPRVKVEEPTDEVCDLCGSPMVVKTSRFGRFLACSSFPGCKGKKPLLKRTGVTCPECGSGELVERKGKGRTFYGCTGYPECTFAVNQRPLPQPCPECGKLLVASGRDRARCISCGHRVPTAELEEEKELAEARA